MASSPPFKIYTPDGEYTASTKHAEEAAALMDFLGDGAIVKYDHRTILWTEGKDGKAGESYDIAAQRLAARQRGGPAKAAPPPGDTTP